MAAIIGSAIRLPQGKFSIATDILEGRKGLEGGKEGKEGKLESWKEGRAAGEAQ
jgi:hypothetical protein